MFKYAHIIIDTYCFMEYCDGVINWDKDFREEFVSREEALKLLRSGEHVEVYCVHGTEIPYGVGSLSTFGNGTLKMNPCYTDVDELPF